MNYLTLWIFIVALFIILGAVVYVFIKDRKASTDKIKQLTEDLEAQKKISTELVHYAEEMAKIKDDKGKVADQIKEAKNEEEVMAIIAGLVNSNNKRVRK